MDGKTYPITHTDAEWRQILTPEQYDVMRRHDTEAPEVARCCRKSSPACFHARRATNRF
jgi:peptide-methionine (R)-S-oxide reductase